MKMYSHLLYKNLLGAYNMPNMCIYTRWTQRQETRKNLLFFVYTDRAIITGKGINKQEMCRLQKIYTYLNGAGFNSQT